MRKLAFCICENKDADQIRGKCKADQRLCFPYTESTIPLLPVEPLAILYGCTAWFVWDLVGNPKDQFSHNEAHMGNSLQLQTLFLTLFNLCNLSIIKLAPFIATYLISIHQTNFKNFVPPETIWKPTMKYWHCPAVLKLLNL